jgi:hypothetical protein
MKVLKEGGLTVSWVRPTEGLSPCENKGYVQKDWNIGLLISLARQRIIAS